MPTYKGNVGNLMQHWTLCELLHIADEQNVPGLNFIDAHAMAPIAHERDDDNNRFNRVRRRLPGQLSIYERAWHQLMPSGGYPNSANFVQRVWTRDFSMLLSERDCATIAALDAWLPGVQAQPRCKRAKVCDGDWRETFQRGLPTPAEVGLPPGSLTLVSFDPNVISLGGRPNPPGPNIHPEDLQLVRAQLAGFGGRVIIQLSTYNAQNNPEVEVNRQVEEILTPGRDGFFHIGTVVVNGHNRSMIYTRRLCDDQWANQLAAMPHRFNGWLQGV